MEMTTVAIWGSIGAAFCLIVGALVGFTIFERRFVAIQSALNECVERNRKYFTQLGEAHENLHKEYNVVRKLEISLLHAGQSIEGVTNDLKKMEDQWKYADNYRKAIVQAMLDHNIWDFGKHGANPAVMLANLCSYVAECAVDPTQNQKAKNLYVKGVRAGAKKGREQMRKLMQKSIDNQAMAINMLNADLTMYIEDRDDIQKKHTLYRIAVINTLNDKVGLVGVRKSIRQALLTEYQRLRSIETKKGE